MVLTVFSEANCAGTSKVLKDSEGNLAKVGVKFKILSAIVDGNPWILYSEERFQGFLAILEEGRYEDMSTLGLPAEYKVSSVKYKKESLANPQITLFNYANFKDETVEYRKEMEGTKIKWMSLGNAGVWAVKNDYTVLYREGTGHGMGVQGTAWTAIMGKMRQVSVGNQVVWGVNTADEVFVRVGLNKEEPKGKEWTKIDGSMKIVSVGSSGICWAVDKKDTVWRRLGAKESNPIGTKWQSVTGRLTHISVGNSGIWGISPKNEVMYRDQTYGLPGEGEGSGWTKVDGFMVDINSGENCVTGVSANGELWYRAGIDQTNPMGNNWFKLKTGADKNIEWKLAAIYSDHLFGTDKEDTLMYRGEAGADKIIPGNSVNLYDENGNFKSFDIQEKPCSYIVRNGGWVIYSLGNFKGKTMFHFDGDCYSNDPENKKGPKLRSWQDPIGSIRPMRGLESKSLTVSISMAWDKLKAEHSREIVESIEAKNNAFDYTPAEWNKVHPVSSLVSHSFKLKEPVKECTGTTFQVENVPKSGIPFTTTGTIMETGTDFRQELNSLITFQSDDTASRNRERKEVIRFPPYIQPKTVVKVHIAVHSGIITIPFTASFTSGNNKWSVDGIYTGIDATQVKLEFEETSLLEGGRKISRI